jgi:uncharacterized protein (DUF2236 family)
MGRYVDELLEPARSIGDPPLDAVIDALARARGEEWLAGEIHAVFVSESLPPSLPPELRALLDDQQLPPWADLAKIRAGQDLFSRYGPQIVLALLCSALPNCYAGARGAAALSLSEKLTHHTQRRIIETAQLVLDAMAPGALAPSATGIRTVRKVRLLHAAARHGIQRDPRFDPAWGIPINQEDLLGTLMTFSIVSLDALERLGNDFLPSEKEAYLHAWKVVGWLLGADERLLPVDAREAAELWDAIRRRQFAPSEAGRELTRALVELMHETIPGTMLDGLAPVMIRHLVGDRVADMIGVPPSDWTRALLKPLKAITWLGDSLGDRSKMIAKLTGRLGRSLLEGLFWVSRGGKKIHFRISPALRAQWGIVEMEG